MDGFGDLGFLHTPSMKLIHSENAVSALGRIVAGADCKGIWEKFVRGHHIFGF
jgi:hypothetical protein